jgi:hypothetical protein
MRKMRKERKEGKKARVKECFYVLGDKEGAEIPLLG